MIITIKHHTTERSNQQEKRRAIAGAAFAQRWREARLGGIVHQNKDDALRPTEGNRTRNALDFEPDFMHATHPNEPLFYPPSTMLSRRRHAVVIETMNHYLVRSQPYWFHRAGVEVTLACDPGFPMARSRYVSRVLPTPLPLDERADALYKLATRGEAGLIILSTEPLVERLAQTPERLSAITGARADFAAACVSRSRLMQWAQEAGLPVAPSRHCEDANDAAEAVCQMGESMLKFPHSSGGEGIVFVATPEDALTAWRRQPEPSGAIVQAYIPGKVGITETLMSGGRLLAWNSSFKYRTTRRFGPSCARESAQLPSDGETARRFAEACGANGYFGFDWVLDERTGQIAIIEIHSRVTSGMSFFAQCGVALDQALHDLASGNPEADTQAPNGLPQRSFYFPEHLTYVARHRHLNDLWHWAPFSQGKAWVNIPWGDPLPECHNLLKRTRSYLRRKQASSVAPSEIKPDTLQHKVRT